MNQGRSRGARVDGCVRTVIIISGNQTLNYGRGRRLRLSRPTTLSSLESIERTRTIIDEPSKDPFLVHKITPPPFFTGHIRPNERTPLASHPTERSSWLKHIHSIPFLSITWINRDHPKEVAISPSLPLSPVSCRRLLQAGARDRCLKRRTSRITFILSAPPDALRDHKAEGQGDEQQRSKKRNIS